MRITNLEKSLGNFTLSIKDLKIGYGLNHCFIGFNGSGKSTLAKLIMGLIKTDHGVIDLGDLDPMEITLTMQRPYLIQASLYDNITYPLRIRGILTKDKEIEIEYYLKKLDLIDKKDQYAHSLSSGERQKLSMIRALIFDPKLLIIDESLSNMDMTSKDIFDQILIDRQKIGRTCILITHQLAHAKKLCQVAHFFDDGKIVESGDIEKVFFNSDNEKIRNYIKSQLIEVDK